jgi:HEAT repeat protein
MAVRLRNRGWKIILVVLLAGLAAWGVYRTDARRSRAEVLHQVLLYTSADRVVRSRAVEEVKAMGNPAVSRLIDMLGEEDSFIRTSMLRQIYRMPPSVRDFLIQRIHTLSAGDIRMYTAHLLGELGTGASNAIPALATRLDEDSSREVVWAAAQSLGRMGSNAIPALVERLHSPRDITRHASAFALGTMGSQARPAIPALTRVLTDPYEAARVSAAYSIHVASRPMGQGLIDVVVSNQGLARITAARAMAQFGSSARLAHPALAVMAESGSPVERLAAVEAIPRIQPWTPWGMSAMLAAFDDASPLVRQCATNCLITNLVSDRTLGGLSLVLSRGTPVIQKRAVLLLARGGTNALPFAARVQCLLTNSDETLRSAAVEALGAMTNGGAISK